MTLDFLSLAYFLCLAASLGFIAIIFFAFRKASRAVKHGVIFALMAFNILQHLLKSQIWPHLWGAGFGLQNTAYNVCATLILFSPFVYLSKGVMRDGLVYVGTAGPLLAIVVPFWFQGQPLFQWEVLRFYVCHVLLIATSVLPALWGLHKLSYRRFAGIPLFFFGILIVIVFNTVVCYAAGMVDNSAPLYDVLYQNNPCWLMHPAPPAGFEWTQTVLETLSPPMFLPTAEHSYIPLLWYAMPMYLGIALLALLIGIAVDCKRFAADVKRFFTNAPPEGGNV